jgi:alginate O-acetyltransferase complex protein AlgI
LGFLAGGFIFMCLARRNSPSSRFLLPVLVCATILLFGWLKRYGFFPSNLFIPFPYLVVGLSYVFFRVLHLIIDASAGALPAVVAPVSYINYTINFTAFIAGPIQRYQDYKAQEDSSGRIDLVGAALAAERIIIGFFKVFALSFILHQWQVSTISKLSDSIDLATRVEYGVIIAAAYPLFLYFNFSGYTDVVIGAGRFFGLTLPENFNNPFQAVNFIEFWSRWHITLSTWLKTYVYNTLLIKLMERFPSRRIEPFLGVAAFFVTFFLVGIWHGQTSEFLMFGFFQGGGVAANKFYQITMTNRLGRRGYKALSANRYYEICCRGLTFVWFTFTLFWFWSSWDDIGNFYVKLGFTGACFAWFTILLASWIGLEVIKRTANTALLLKCGASSVVLSKYVRAIYLAIITVITFSVILLSNSPIPDIVYKSF